ncbi:hypothetical protein [Sphingomonas albertensis]|uniref:Trypsin-like serine protease n=1 Tax=Sphingomonas albertensis TaxID=2762591 RepID=A0ABR7AK61_9SPHN|nr:hypothetical protein [Sphingomonas albertensis]MBC3940845.1 hypothetical protein [Sphingomonas albertensis]
MLKSLIRGTASALLAVAMATASAAQVAPPPTSGPAHVQAHVQLPVDALMQDAGEYARRFGVPFDEALRRLRAQGDSVPATDALRETFKDRWAGIAIEHLPTYRIVVLLTGTDPVPDQQVVAGGMTVPIVFRTGAAATREAVLAAITTYQAKIRDSLPHPPGLGVDQRTGELVVMTASSDADLDRNGELRERIAAMTGVPVRIDVVDRPPVDMQAVIAPAAPAVAPASSGAIEGGGRVVGTVDGKRYACTTGFVVSDGIRNGVVTAAHCPDTLSYVGKRPSDGSREDWPLAFVGQWGWGYQDVQVNIATAPGIAYAPLFYADTAKTLARPVATWRYRTSTRAGDFVCHRGERTGYSCAVVAMVDFAPAGDLCGGACLPTWVAVEGPTCKAGDSGAPVFEGTTALGIVKGGTYRRDGTCLFYYYMSTDYLPQGWTLLHQ